MASAARARAKTKLPPTLSREEVERLLAAPNTRYPTGIRNRAMLVLLYRSGLRVAELCALRPRDLDLKRGTIRVWGGKTGDGLARFDVDFVAPVLEEWRRARRRFPASEWLFSTHRGTAVTPDYVRKMVKRMARRAGIESRCTPHVLRHTFASEALAEDFDLREVQLLLRHASVQSTQIYAHVANPQLDRKIQRRSKRRRVVA